MHLFVLLLLIIKVKKKCHSCFTLFQASFDHYCYGRRDKIYVTVLERGRVRQGGLVWRYQSFTHVWKSVHKCVFRQVFQSPATTNIWSLQLDCLCSRMFIVLLLAMLGKFINTNSSATHCYFIFVKYCIYPPLQGCAAAAKMAVSLWVSVCLNVWFSKNLKKYIYIHVFYW